MSSSFSDCMIQDTTASPSQVSKPLGVAHFDSSVPTRRLGSYKSSDRYCFGGVLYGGSVLYIGPLVCCRYQ